MTGKSDGHAHGKQGHRPANHPALWLVVILGGLCLSCALWSLTGPHKPAGSKPRAVSEEALEVLARNLALRGGTYALRPPAASWGAALGWGPTAQPSARGGKHVLVSLAEVVPERLNVLAASLRRWAPATKLVVFAPEASGGTEWLEAAGERAAHVWSGCIKAGHQRFCRWTACGLRVHCRARPAHKLPD